MSSTRSCCLLLTVAWGKLLLEHTVTFCVWGGRNLAVVVLQSDVGIILCLLSSPLPLWCYAEVLGKPHGLWPGVLGQVGAWMLTASMEIGCCLSFPTWHPTVLYCLGELRACLGPPQGKRSYKFPISLKQQEPPLDNFWRKEDFFF